MGILITLLAIVVGIAVAAIILRLAAKIVSAPEIPFGKAMLIVVVAFFATAAAGFILGLILGQGILAQLVSLVVGACVSALIYSKMIPTSFGKGILIYVMQIVVVFVIGLIVAVLFGGMAALSS